MKVQVGQTIPSFTVQTIQGTQVTVPDSSPKFTHLQFRRFAGCPICNLHLHTFLKSFDQIEAAGIREVIFFHSSASEMKKYQKDIAFAAVADPQMTFYSRFGVGRSIWASLHPRSLWAALQGMLLGKMGLKMENGPLGLPADILIDQAGTVVAVKYGTYAYDQWEVPDLLKIAQGVG